MPESVDTRFDPALAGIRWNLHWVLGRLRISLFGASSFTMNDAPAPLSPRQFISIHFVVLQFICSICSLRRQGHVGGGGPTKKADCGNAFGTKVSGFYLYLVISKVTELTKFLFTRGTGFWLIAKWASAYSLSIISYVFKDLGCFQSGVTSIYPNVLDL